MGFPTLKKNFWGSLQLTDAYSQSSFDLDLIDVIMDDRNHMLVFWHSFPEVFLENLRKTRHFLEQVLWTNHQNISRK